MRAVRYLHFHYNPRQLFCSEWGYSKIIGVRVLFDKALTDQSVRITMRRVPLLSA